MPRQQDSNSLVGAVNASGATDAPLAAFHPSVADWFRSRHGRPTEAQSACWAEVRAGRHVLLAAPTGSGKTLAAFLVAIDDLVRRGPAEDPGIAVLYVSPLKALNNDVERNLREPLQGVAARGAAVPTASVRTGDTPAAERQRQMRRPPDILITTPESLFILLTSPRAHRCLQTVGTVIVDEIHAMAGNKRGTHLALSIERLEHLVTAGGRPAPRRIGLSATQRPLQAIASFLGGPHDVTVVDRSAPRAMDLCVSVPVPDFRDLPGDSVWDSVAPVVLDDVRRHRTTLIFVPGRASAEGLTRRINGLAGEEVCRAHHGSVSLQARREIEAALKEGRLPALCATSTLELGIDIGSADFVVMVGGTGGVARGLQRIGRSGHAVGGRSAGRILCTTPLGLAEAAICGRDMSRGLIEPTRIPSRCLDVLAQHLVSLAACGTWPTRELGGLLRRAAPYRELQAPDLEGVMGLLSGRYPAERFSGLRARLVWDREAAVVRGRPGSAQSALRGAGSIPDRGLFAVVGPDGQRLGELDEEFVHESRRGDVFVLGTTQWRIASITADRVHVVPGSGPMPRLPFWHGDGPPRPAELGARMAAFWGQAARHIDDDAWWRTEAAACRLDDDASSALRRLLREQRAAGCLPTDERLVLEWYRDPLGDVRLCVHAPYGRAVTGPWAIAAAALLRRQGINADAAATENGFLLRTAARDAAPPTDLLHRFSPHQLVQALVADLPSTSLFASRFRECAGRALLLERGGPGRRLPLWLQRLRAADLLAVARGDPDFPIVRETMRECLEDHFDLPVWCGLLEALADGRVAGRVVERSGPSPFAAEMEFRFKAEGLYGKDAPRAEQGAAALASAGGGWAEAAGRYLDAAEVAVARRLQPPADSPDELHDRLLQAGPLTAGEAAAVEPHARALVAAGRARRDEAGRLVAAEEWPAWRAAVEGSVEQRRRLTLRFAASVAGFTSEDLRGRFGWEVDLDGLPLLRLPDGRHAHPEVARRVRRRALALARADVAPVPAGVFAAFVRRRHRGDVGAVLSNWQGLAAPIGVWCHELLPSRVDGFRTDDLERCVAQGRFLWVAHGDRVAFFARERYALLAAGAPIAPDPDAPEELRTLLPEGRALWFADLLACSALPPTELAMRLQAWLRRGWVSNDSLQPLLSDHPRRPALGARWSVVAEQPANAAGAAEAWAEQLLDRYGVVARLVWERAVARLSWTAGAAALRRMEASGRVRRGHFVRGLGGLQFARTADVDGLRETSAGATWCVAALDPACVWREAPRRPGSYVVVAGGEPVMEVSGYGRRLKALRCLEGAALQEAVSALRDVAAPRGRVEVATWNGGPVLDAPEPVLAALRLAGFRRGPTTLRWRAG